jgi:hypothetical protein
VIWLPIIAVLGGLGVGLGVYAPVALLTYSILVFCCVTLITWTGPRRDVFSPLPVVLCFFVLSYTWQIVLFREREDIFSGLFPYQAARMFRYTGWIAGVAVVAISSLAWGVQTYAGANASTKTIRNSLRPLDTYKPKPGQWHRAVLVTIVGLALSFLYIILAGGLRNVLLNLYNRTVFQAGKNYLASGPIVVFAAALSAFIVLGRRHWLRTTAFLSFAMLLTFITGSKANIALELGSIVIVFHYKIRPLARVLLVTIVASAVFALTFYNLYFRNALPRNIPLAQAVRESGGLGAIPQAFAGNTFFGAQALGVARDRFVFPNDAEFWRVYTPLVEAPIPRGLLPGKLPAFSEVFTRSFAPTLAESGTTYPATGIAEFYIAGGLVGVIVGSFGVGLLLGFAYSTRLSSPWGLARYAILLPLVPHFIRGEAYGVGILGVTTLFPCWLILRRGPSSAVVRHTQTNRNA